MVDRALDLGIVDGKALPGFNDHRQVLTRSGARGRLGDRRLEQGECFPDFQESDVVHRQCTAHAFRDGSVLRAADGHSPGAGSARDETVALQFAQSLADRGAIDAELPCELRLGGQALTLAQPPVHDPLADGGGHLPIGGLDKDMLELDAHAAASNNSRPISIRRISCVPAPIS